MESVTEPVGILGNSRGAADDWLLATETASSQEGGASRACATRALPGCAATAPAVCHPRGFHYKLRRMGHTAMTDLLKRAHLVP